MGFIHIGSPEVYIVCYHGNHLMWLGGTYILYILSKIQLLNHTIHSN